VRSLALAGVTALLVTPVASADEPTARSAVSAEILRSNDQTRRPEERIAKRYEQIRAEFEAQLAAQRSAASKAESPRENTAAAAKSISDLVVDYCRRMVGLAESSPDEPAARDALLWVLDNAGRGDVRADRDQFARAAALLVRHHGNNPEAVRFAVAPPNNPVTPRYEALLLGFYAAATGREAKGLARLALAQYLVNKARAVGYARGVEGRPKRRYLSGGKVVREVDLTDEQYADHLALRQCDPKAIEAEAKQLFEEVIAEYGDVPNVTRRALELEALLKEPAPPRNGKPLTAQGRRGIEESLARRNKTLGLEAEAWLDAMLNLAVGKPAPEIDGVDADGKPLKLSNYRGKVVLLVFWGSWCSPCLALVPHERELAERYKGHPFTLLGVDCKDTREIARNTIQKEKITWPNWHDGDEAGGPIATLYNVRSYPSMLVLDARGIIRSRGPVVVDALIETLVKEAEAGGRSGTPTSPPR
jgi:thiol-disulfide isomerase/thioredoxin